MMVLDVAYQQNQFTIKVNGTTSSSSGVDNLSKYVIGLMQRSGFALEGMSDTAMTGILKALGDKTFSGGQTASSFLVDMLTKHDDQDGFFVSEGKLKDFFSSAFKGVNPGQQSPADSAAVIAGNLNNLKNNPLSVNGGQADKLLATATPTQAGSTPEAMLRGMLQIASVPVPTSAQLPAPVQSAMESKLPQLIAKYNLGKGDFISFSDVKQWSVADKEWLADALGVTQADLFKSSQSFTRAVAGYQVQHSSEHLGSNESGTRLDQVDGLLGIKTLSSLAHPAQAESSITPSVSTSIEDKWKQFKVDGTLSRKDFIDAAAKLLGGSDLAKVELIKTALSWLDDEFGMLDADNYKDFIRFNPSEQFLETIKNDKDTFASLQYSDVSSGALRTLYGNEHQYSEVFDAARTARGLSDAGLSNRFFSAVLQSESAGNAGAVSNKGARGLLQLMPETAHAEAQLILSQTPEAKIPANILEGLRSVAAGHDGALSDPNVSIFLGTHYLNGIYTDLKAAHPTWSEDKLLSFTAAGYNAGPNRDSVKSGSYGELPSETKAYVSKIMTMVRNSTMDQLDGTADATAREAIYHKNVVSGGVSGTRYGHAVDSVNLEPFDQKSQQLILKAREHVGTPYVKNGVHDCFDFAQLMNKFPEGTASNKPHKLEDFRNMAFNHKLDSGTPIQTPDASMNGTGNDHWGVLLYDKNQQPYVLHFSGTGKEAVAPLDLFLKNVGSQGTVNYRLPLN